MSPPPLRSLFARIQEGDREAFAEAYAAHRPRLYNFLARMTNEPAVAEELLQETWTRLATKAKGLAEDTDLVAWLYTVARNLARDSLRSDRRARAEGSAEAASSESPEDWAAASETHERLTQALAALPPGEREVILLVCVDGMRQDQAAKVLGIGHDAVRQRVTRARARLALSLERPRVVGEHNARAEEEHGHARH